MFWFAFRLIDLANGAFLMTENSNVKSNASNAKFVWIGIEDPTTDRRKQTIDLYNIDVSGVNSCY